ncbi:hypothetical protein [Bacteroides acidifaciens]|uniref:hypothetical protein n=1 Tax=Bacteroides acidifaciens TaxID=85831 RepID=UPI0025A53DB9|nr:hypothetical protein [Bacteroides acidifaciens]
MKKIMFSDKFGLTEAVLSGRKTQTRRICPDGTPLGNWAETVKKSRYQVGEVVAVAQRYKDIGLAAEAPLMEANGIGGYVKTELSPGWANKMFVRADLMPHQIRITDVRVERLQDISYEDCIKEGIRKWTKDYEIFKYDMSEGFEIFKWIDKPRTPRSAYAALIDKVSGKGAWDSNPYVFVYEFELIK